jgi:hypothetical protein
VLKTQGITFAVGEIKAEAFFKTAFSSKKAD